MIANVWYVFLGSVILGAAASMLGVFAVLRKQGLMGDALAHASLPGIAVAFLIMQTKFLPGLLLGALISGLIGAALISFLVRQTKIKMDSAMASVLSVFFGIGILLLTYIQKLPLASQAGLESFLFGQAAALIKTDVYWMLSVFVVILVMVVVFWKELKLFMFDSEFAWVVGFKRWALELLFMTIFVASILMSLQAVGVVLTAALFVTPAVSALLWTKRLISAVILSSIIGMLAGGTGALMSAYFAKTPTGPVIVIFSTLIFFISFFLAPEKGFLWRGISHLRGARKMRMENILGRLYRDYEKGIRQWGDVQMASTLKRRGLIERTDSKGAKLWTLTENGWKEAFCVVEKHRLWETYLVNKMRLPLDHVHRDAEEMEHILTDEMVVELKKILQDPPKDPHGQSLKPIK